jgi:hypothetical protein
VRALVVAVAALLVATPVAAAETESTSSGAVAATLSWTPDDNGFGATGVRVVVTRGGVLAYDAPVDPRGACKDATCIPRDDGFVARDVDADGEPEVVTDLYTGGAHCCDISRILRWDGARYVAVDHDWGDRGYRLEDLDADGRSEFVTSDDRFAYLYGSYGSSAFPVRILALRGTAMVDVTSAFPAVVRGDRAALHRLARKADYARPVYGAWAADRYRLGQRAATLRTLRRLAAQGRLRTDLGSNSPAAQRRWVARLDRDLRRFGYAGSTT